MFTDSAPLQSPLWKQLSTDFASAAVPPVGASLLAMTAAHPTSPAQTDRNREQARSHSFDRGCPLILRPPQPPPVGASLLAMTAAHPTSPAQTDRNREQARSHSFDPPASVPVLPASCPPRGASYLFFCGMTTFQISFKKNNHTSLVNLSIFQFLLGFWVDSPHETSE